jgi:KDO2-lipid IV(A) lauroyltransferase
MRSRWKRIRYRLEWLALFLAAQLIPLLSRKVCYHLAKAGGAVVSILDRHGCKVALSNLEVAFGDQLSSDQRRKIARESFQHFARTMVDLFWSPRLTRENFSRYIEIENLERLQRDIGERGSGIFACLHYGNFEWVSIGMGFCGYSSNILSQEFKNRLLGPIVDSLRATSGHLMVHREGGMVRLYKALRRNGRVAILIDLTLPPSMPAVVIECFGLKTCVPFAHAWLHERTGSPIIPLHSEPLPDGRWRVIVHEKLEIQPGMNHQQVAQACWNRFEPVIRKNPAPWLWAYKHWRYRPANAARPYPFYANFMRRFEEMLEQDQDSRYNTATG